MSNIIKQVFDKKPIRNEKYLKTKRKSYKGKINANFHHYRMPKQGSHCIFLSVTLIDPVFKMGKNYYPQVSSEGCIVINEFVYET